MKGRILIVDDEAPMCEMLAELLVSRDHEVVWFTETEPAIAAVSEQDFDMVITDVQLGRENGLDLCRRVVERRPELPVVVITAFGSMDAAIAAIRAGAYDFINKPIEPGVMALVVDRALEHSRLRHEVRRLNEAVKGARRFDTMIGESRPMKRVYDLITRLSDSDAPVLISGESGTGKELVAKALHDGSRQASGPFVAINCAAVPSTLLESTLFGHVKGAFTDAKTSQRGLFLEAHGGTLLLDEIGDMPLDMQSKLLRVLQDRVVRPVGGSEEVPFDTRIIAATNRDLEEDVQDAKFREDLFYRIAVVVIEVPPLRVRGNDVLLLAQHFLEGAARRSGRQVMGIASEAARKLIDYDWPGNVRQLQNVMERAVALTRFDSINVDDLPEKVTHYRPSHMVVDDDDPDQMLTLEELERRYIERVLKSTGGNKTRAAKVLGVDRRTLYRKLKREDA